MSTNYATRPDALPDAQRPTASATGWVGGREPNRSWRGARRRRSVPHLVLGVLLVLVCTIGFLVVSLSSGSRQPVLALARAVTVGQVLAPADLRQVDVAVDPAVSVVSAGQASSVVGRVMATSLPAGALLSLDVLGPAAIPSAGRAIVALALETGQLPVEVSPGAAVSVVLVPAQPAAAATTGSATAVPAPVTWPAVVTAVSAPPDERVTVVSVQLSEADAREVAAVPAGQLSVVMLAGDR